MSCWPYLFQLMANFKGLILRNPKVRWFLKSRIESRYLAGFSISNFGSHLTWIFQNQVFKIGHKLKQTGPLLVWECKCLNFIWNRFKIVFLGNMSGNKFKIVIHTANEHSNDGALSFIHSRMHEFSWGGWATCTTGFMGPREPALQVAAVLSRRAEGIGWETCVHALASSIVQPTKSQDLMETSAWLEHWVEVVERHNA